MVGTVIFSVASFILMIIGKLAFIWGPLIAMYLGLEMWHHLVTDRFIVGMQWTLFEIEVPREVEKTPMAMELILTNAMYHASSKGLWETWVVGAPHFWFSLEIAGVDGRVGFYVRTPSRVRDLVETQIYAQYPQAKVRECEDYTLRVPYDAPNKDWYVWACEFKLLEHDAVPIRTYKDYGLDKPSDKEQQKIDPLTPTIEFLGSLPRGQQVWIQHVIRPSKKDWHSHVTHGHIGWVEAAREEMSRIMTPYTEQFIRTQADKKSADKNGLAGITDFGYQIRLPDPVSAKIKKMQEKIQKLGFDIGTRVVAVGEARYTTADEFANLRRAMRLLFRQYSNPDLNQFVRTNSTGFDTPWADPTGMIVKRMSNRMLNWYRLRMFFHVPLWNSFAQKGIFGKVFLPNGRPNINVLNVEEIATIFHLPGQVSQAPSFKRVDSRVAKPPANLPI